MIIVIGDRLGKGKNVAMGIESAGLKAIVVAGIGADMRLGDEMNKVKADLGISFCGSGGAGAITAQSKYGYKAKHGLRSIDAGVTAVRDGFEVLGFGFMDTEALGKAIAEALIIRENGK